MSTPDLPPLAQNWTAPPSVEELIHDGLAARDRVPRESLADLDTTGRDPMAILDAQDVSRLQELVPIRTQRMAESAFAFYRGSAALMAADLSRSPDSGLHVGSCGDAHVANFGLYASPQRTIAFDLNDFDEAAWAPWDWDVKRLVTSIVVAGQATSRDDAVVRRAALGAVRAYARALEHSARRSPLDRYYDRVNIEVSAEQYDEESRAAMKQAIKDAEKRTGARAARRLTTVGDGGRVVFVEQPPEMTHVDAYRERQVRALVERYATTTNIDIRILLQKYRPSDVALRVVGVGSVGTRCYVISLQAGDSDVLVMQAKEAETSVLVKYGKVAQPEGVEDYIDEFGDGARVVGMQRMLQAVSDPFLGHLYGRPEGGGPKRAFYVRQFHDMKGGFDTDALEDDAFHWYALACGATLARAHGQSPNAEAVAGYVGGGRIAGAAIVEWAYTYADLSRADWQLFRRHRGVDA